MAIKTSDEIMASIRAKIGDDTSDESIALMEDVSDTFKDLEGKTKDATNWKNKYEENDRQWREKYRDRFYKGNDEQEDDDNDDEPPKQMRFEDLFKEG